MQDLEGAHATHMVCDLGEGHYAGRDEPELQARHQAGGRCGAWVCGWMWEHEQRLRPGGCASSSVWTVFVTGKDVGLRCVYPQRHQDVPDCTYRGGAAGVVCVPRCVSTGVSTW